ncbi:hypothetical protein WN67_14590 [Mycolicibacterium obuense]|uniref:Uncharacterized protein n=1 Tax=Mycolicibacterium obuense TaxID=1807 RepID=A0A0M2K2A7_9MYCO|nr:hypothetical protein WN67_14590 [Mycolicibacterium obuense]
MPGRRQIVVKNRRAKLAAREYQRAHPGRSYEQARRESRQEYERTRSTNDLTAHADDVPRIVARPLSANYLTNPFGLSQDEDADDVEQR